MWFLACRRWCPTATYKPFLLGLVIGGPHRTIAGSIHGDRFFHEHVLAKLHGRRELRRAESRRRAQEHDIRPRGDRLLVGVEPHEPAGGRHVDLVAELALQVLVRALDRLGERIGQGDELDVAVGVVPHRIGRGARASASATDERDLDLVAARRECGMSKLETADRGCSRRALDEFSTRDAGSRRLSHERGPVERS